MMDHETTAEQRTATSLSVFSAVFAILYGICDVERWPLFSYYPVTGRLTWGWTPETADDGPAMYWYGWIASSLIGATVAALAVTVLPQRIRQMISPHTAWFIPLLMIPVMAYTLKVYWR